MRKFGLFMPSRKTFGSVITILILNLSGAGQLLSQIPENSGDSLISVTKYLGGEKLEYEHSTVYTFSGQTLRRDLETTYDSLMALGLFPGIEKLEFTGGTIYYNPKITEIINTDYKDLDPSDPLFDSTSAMATDPVLIKSPIVEGSAEKFIFAFSWGPSDDFGFDIYRDDEKRTFVGGMSGYTMYVPGNGYVYVEGHTNNSFNHRKKYRLRNGKFVESTQAFYYVGLKTTITAPMKLYSDTTYKEVVASLVENQPVEVLIADFNENSGDGHDYLIKTPFGLTGWVRISSSYPRTHIKGIYYAGD